MFADPIIVANDGTPLTLPRVDAGPMTGKYMSVVPGVSAEMLNIRNSSYFSKVDKRNYNRHNVELARTKTIAATSIAPETFSKVKAYIVVEHDDKATLAEIQQVCQELALFVVESYNPGFVQKLINNEG